MSPGCLGTRCELGDREQDAGDEGEIGSGDEEPTLGWNAIGCTSGGSYGEDGELKPSLGSIERAPQTTWSAGSRSDREIDAGDEPEIVHEVDDELQQGRRECRA